jgi:hypothetical protein
VPLRSRGRGDILFLLSATCHSARVVVIIIIIIIIIIIVVVVVIVHQRFVALLYQQFWRTRDTTNSGCVRARELGAAFRFSRDKLFTCPVPMKRSVLETFHEYR